MYVSNCQNLEESKIFSNHWTNKKLWYSHTLKYHLAKTNWEKVISDSGIKRFWTHVLLTQQIYS